MSSELHFAVASDGHYGEPGTDGAARFAALVAALNQAHAARRFDFVVINGDISHGGTAAASAARTELEKLDPPFFVTQGNHDELSPAQWQQVWGTPGNQVKRFGERSLILANTSNAAGDYLCPDPGFLAEALRSEAEQRDVLVFFHITPQTWTTHGIDCPATRALLAQATNVRAVFNGHDHDQRAEKTDAGVRYLFNGHFGGSWGGDDLTYREVTITEGEITTGVVVLS